MSRTWLAVDRREFANGCGVHGLFVRDGHPRVRAPFALCVSGLDEATNERRRIRPANREHRRRWFLALETPIQLWERLLRAGMRCQRRCRRCNDEVNEGLRPNAPASWYEVASALDVMRETCGRKVPQTEGVAGST